MSALQAKRMAVEHSTLEGGLLLLVTLLVGGGVIMVFSTQIADPNSLALRYDYLKRHLVHLCLGLICAFIMSRVPLVWVRGLALPGLLFAVLILILVLVPGIGAEVNGSRRWLSLFGLRAQPAELAKLAMLVYCADYLVRKQAQLDEWRVGIGVIGGVLAVPVLLMLMQPDFGSSALMTLTVGGMLFLAGIRLRHFLLAVVFGLLAGAWLVLSESYRLKRLLAFQDPWNDAFGSGFQLVQALIAIGRGEWFGVGLGNSIQKLFYLPHAHNDFLLAIVGEELGSVGMLAVLALFAGLVVVIFRMADRAERHGDPFSALLARGIGLLFGLQAGVHAGVNLGLLPTKGLNLPLMSYGGSSMVVSMLALGLVWGIARQQARAPARRSKSRGGRS